MWEKIFGCCNQSKLRGQLRPVIYWGNSNVEGLEC